MKSLQRLPQQLLGTQKPSAIVIVSAHYEGKNKVLVGAKEEYPKVLFDYGGFPDHTYEIEYKAPGHPLLASRICDLLKNKGISSELDANRNWDHGVFVPLKVMFPDADIPVVAVSILKSYDAKEHIAIGKALKPLRDEGVLILGSGYATHNLRGLSSSNNLFINSLSHLISSTSPQEREKGFENWEEIPEARKAHEKEDHLMPLHVMVGAAGDDVGVTLFRLDTLRGLATFAHFGFGV